MKGILQIFLVFMLSFSILAPAIIEICNEDTDTIVSKNIGQEDFESENSNKPDEFKKKKPIILSLELREAGEFAKKRVDAFHYSEKELKLISPVFLPPPKKV